MVGGVRLPRRFMFSDGVVAREDPVWFVKRFLDARPWSKQREVLRALRDHDLVAVRSCNGSGKTFTAALATLWWLCAHDEAMVITTAPTERQVKDLLWREIRHLHGKNPEAIGGKLTSTRLELSEKRFAYGFSTDTAGRFQGFHSGNILVIVDEAAEMREFIFDAIFGCLTSENAKMLMIGNPSSLAGTFYDAFHKNRSRWKTIHISAFDTPAFLAEEGGGPPLSSVSGTRQAPDISPAEREAGPLCPSDISPDEREAGPLCPSDISPDEREAGPLCPSDISPAEREAGPLCPADISPAEREAGPLCPADISPAEREAGPLCPSDISPAEREAGPLCPSDISPAERGKPDDPAYVDSRLRGDDGDEPGDGDGTSDGELGGHPPLASHGSLAPPYALRRGRGAELSLDASIDASIDALGTGLKRAPTIPSGMATPKWAEMIGDQRGVSSAEYQSRVLGEFPEEADDTLIAMRLIEAAVGREFEVVIDDEAVMGVDVARYGNNQTVAIVRRGSSVVDMLSFGRSDLMNTTGRVIDLARRHDVKRMHVDVVGLGAGVVDRARELNSVRTIGVNGGSKASDSEKHLNLRAEMYDGLRQRFADGDISIPDDPELISQLASLTFSYTSRGQLQIESKDRIRSSGRQSPDKADALALAFGKGVDRNEFWMMVWDGERYVRI